MNKCKDCYYGSQEFGSRGCNYCLFEGELRGCEIEDCDKFLLKEKDYNERRACSSCRFYEIEDMFSGRCTKEDKGTLAYHPSCSKWKMVKQRVCGTCSHSVIRTGSVYCKYNRRYVNYSDLCNAHHFKVERC